MRIREISTINKKKSKVLTEEGFAFSLYQSELLAYGIAEDAELEEERYLECIRPLLLRRAKERLLYLLKERERTEWELRNKLKEGVYPEDIAEEAIEWAKAHRYADDRRYVQFYIEINKEKRSRMDILMRLLRKGIDKELAEEELEKEAIPEEDLIRKELRKKSYTGKAKSMKEKQSLYRYLSGKGFSFEAIRNVMGEEEEF